MATRDLITANDALWCTFEPTLRQRLADLDAEIGFLLGFDETSSFYRAFRAWTGSTPEATRAELTGPR